MMEESGWSVLQRSSGGGGLEARRILAQIQHNKHNTETQLTITAFEW